MVATSSQINDHPISGCRITWNINELSPSLHYFSATSALLRLSLPPILHTILVWPFPVMVSGAVSASLVPYKSLCWSSRFGGMKHLPTLPRMLCNQKSDLPLHFLTDTNVNICFQHLLVNFTRLLSLVHSIQLINTHLRKSLFPFFLIPAYRSIRAGFTTKRVSALSSIRWFANYFWSRLKRDGSPFLF